MRSANSNGSQPPPGRRADEDYGFVTIVASVSLGSLAVTDGHSSSSSTTTAAGRVGVLWTDGIDGEEDIGLAASGAATGVASDDPVADPGRLGSAAVAPGCVGSL